MASRCEYCRREFESEIGLRAHAGQRHPKPRGRKIYYSYWKHFNQILNEIRELAALTENPTISEFKAIFGPREYTYLKGWFGSWVMACLVAGVRPGRLEYTNVDERWITSEIIDQDFDPEQLAANTPLTKADVERVFGSWSDAVSFARELGERPLRSP